MTRSAHQQASGSSDLVAERTELLTLDGECDMTSAPEFEQQLHEALDAKQADIVVDLRGVSFLDSTMLQALLSGLRRAKEQDAGFALIRPPALVWRVFVLTGVSDRFVTYSSLSEALALN
jgi:anti-sigma B factor antagonist